MNQVSPSTSVPDFHLIAQQYSQLMSLLQTHTSNAITPDIESSNTGMVLFASLLSFLKIIGLLIRVPTLTLFVPLISLIPITMSQIELLNCLIMQLSQSLQLALYIYLLL